MSSNVRRFIFNAGATVYDILTYQETWRRHSQKLAPADRTYGNILDVGCGPGISSFALEEQHPDAHITGIDVAQKMIERARQRKKQTKSSVEFLLADAGRLPFHDNQFDLVTGHSFLYLLEHPERVLGEIRRVLRPGGRAAFLEPRAHPGFGWFLPTLRNGLRFFSTMVGWQVSSSLSGRFEREDLESLLIDAGFTVKTIEVTLNGLGWLVTIEGT